MTGKTLSLRMFALVFGIACAIFAVTAGYRGLLAHTNPITAPVTMAIISAFAAISFIVMAQIRAARRRARMKALMSTLIDHKPLAGLAAAVVAGAAARFGIEPDDLFPIFEAFTTPHDDEAVPDQARPHTAPTSAPLHPTQSVH
jgi:cobalamin synthase